MLKNVNKVKDGNSKFSKFLTKSQSNCIPLDQSKTNLLESQDYKAAKFKTSNRKILEGVNSRFTNKSEFCLTEEDQLNRQTPQHKSIEKKYIPIKSNRFKSMSIVDSIILENKSPQNALVIKGKERSYERSRDLNIKNHLKPMTNTK